MPMDQEEKKKKKSTFWDRIGISKNGSEKKTKGTPSSTETSTESSNNRFPSERVTAKSEEKKQSQLKSDAGSEKKEDNSAEQKKGKTRRQKKEDKKREEEERKKQEEERKKQEEERKKKEGELLRDKGADYANDCKKIQDKVDEIKNRNITHTETEKIELEKERSEFDKLTKKQQQDIEIADIDKDVKKELNLYIEWFYLETNKRLKAAEKKQEASREARKNVEHISKKKKMISIFNKLKDFNDTASGNSTAPGNSMTPGNSTAPANGGTGSEGTTKESSFGKVIDAASDFKDDEVISISGKIYEYVESIYSMFTSSCDISVSSLEYAKKSKDAAELVGSSAGYFAAPFSAAKALKAVIFSVIDVCKYLNDKKKRKDNGIGLNEGWQNIRKIYSTIVEFSSGIADSIGAFKDFLPIISPIISMVTSTMSIVENFINVLDSVIRSGRLAYKKKQLWNKMREKHDELDGTKEANYYDLQGSFGFFPNRLVEQKRKYLRGKLASSDGYTNLSGDILKERGKKEQADKERLHIMQALDILEKYHILNEAQDRQLKIFGNQAGDLLLNGIQFGAGVAEFVGEMGAAFSAGASLSITLVGKLTSIVGSSIGIARKIGSKIYQKYSEKSGRTNKKKLRRSQMAENLVESVNILIKDNTFGWNSGSFDLDSIPDYKVQIASDNLDVFDETLIGVDINLQELVLSENKQQFMNVLAASFSQEQEVG